MAFKQFLACAGILVMLGVSGCSEVLPEPIVTEPRITRDTISTQLLKQMPPSRENTIVSVYEFADQTGQLKNRDNFPDYSRAVTQGGLSLLVKALLETANGQWFTVVERGSLKNLLQERQIIQMTRAQYAAPDEPVEQLPPMLYAGLLVEGGVVGYDTNILTGGAGANYLGVGGDTKYRRDIVTVDLRAVNVATGQVLLSVTAEKTLYSLAVSGNAFKFVAFNKLLQAEAGYTLNEPPQLAVRQAIETAVYSLVVQGAIKGMWAFANEAEGQRVAAMYLSQAGD
jgi:curli production assembly/transport component CsgG